MDGARVARHRRADSLGTTLFEVISGRPAFAGDSSDVLIAKARRAPPRLDNVPEELADSVTAAMAPEPPGLSGACRRSPMLCRRAASSGNGVTQRSARQRRSAPRNDAQQTSAS